MLYVTSLHPLSIALDNVQVGLFLLITRGDY